MKRILTSITVVFVMFAMIPSADAAGARPSAPRNVRATISQTSVVVTFKAPQSNGGAKILRFNIKASPTSRVYTSLSTKYTIKGLPTKTAFSFSVAAVNKFGVGKYSAQSNRVTIPAVQVSVSFNANGGTGTMPDQIADLNSSAPLSPNLFANAGYAFSGWNTTANGSGTGYADRATFTFAANTTLYAQWGVSVSFNANGGTGTMAAEVQTVGKTAPLTLNAFTLAGGAFIGWNTAANGTGTSYADGATFTFTTSATLYAQWAVALAPGTHPYANTQVAAGYLVDGAPGGYVAVAAQWSVPRLDCASTPSGHVVAQIGIAGSDGHVAVGTHSACSGGTQTSYAFWDDAESGMDSYLTVAAGDVVEGAIVELTPGLWALQVTDLTTSQVALTMDPYSFTHSAVLWDVSIDSTGSTINPMADFDQITFRNLDYLSASGTFVSPTFSTDAFELKSASGQVTAVPTQVIGSGKSTMFTVYYVLQS